MKARTAAILMIVILLQLLAAQYCFADFTFEDEKKLGRELYDKLEKSDLLLKEPRVAGYVNDLGQKILAQSNKQVPFDFRFSVVKGSAINAFATPGGFVYVNAGTIILADNECELAGVIAHEIAHVNARHIAQMIEKQKKMSFATLAAILAGAVLGGGGAATEALIGMSLATSATLSLKYSRENEEEADRFGMQYMVAAGYDPKGMLDFMKIMKNYEFYSSNIPSYFLTHPGTADRIRYLDGLIHVKYTEKGAEDIFGKLGRIQTLLALQAKEPASALKYFQEKLAKSPGNIDAMYGASVSLAAVGKVQEAEASFSNALKLAPNDNDVLRDFGNMYFNQGNMKQAGVYLKKAYAVNDTDAETMLRLGKCYEEEGGYREALDLYLKYKMRNPGDANIYYNIAMMYGRTGDNAMSHYNFGIFFKKKGKTDSAIHHFEQALKLFAPGSEKYAEISAEIDALKKPRKSSPYPGDQRSPGRKARS